MARKSFEDTGRSWLASDSSSMDPISSIDSEQSFLENQEEADKIRESLKGVPLIGKLKKKFQYTITIVLAVTFFASTIYTGFASYNQNKMIKEMSISAESIGSSLNLLNDQYDKYVSLNEESLNNINESKTDVDKYVAILRSNAYVNSSAIERVDNYWRLQSAKFNIIDGSKDQLSKTNASILDIISSLNENIKIVSNVMKNIAARQDVPSYKSLYLAQILSDMQTLSGKISDLNSSNIDYGSYFNDITRLNDVVMQKISMLLKSGLPTDLDKTLTSMQSNMYNTSGNITTTIRTIVPVENALSKIKTSDLNIKSSISQIVSSIKNIDNNSSFKLSIECLVSFILFVMFFTSIFLVNAKELSKDIIVAEEQRKSVENAVIRIINDVNSISSGDYDRKVRNTTDSLIGLKDAINKLVDSFIDRFSLIYKNAKDIKEDNGAYEKHLLSFIENTQTILLNKNELSDNEKNQNNLMLELKASNIEVHSSLSSLLPDFNDAQQEIALLLEINKEMENSKLNISNKHRKLSDNFNKIKQGLENLNKLCEFIEALSLNSEILSKKTMSDNNNSFNRIAEDFNKKVQNIREECNSLAIFIEDSKNDLLTITKNTKELETYSNDAKMYINTVKKVFTPLSALLNLVKSSGTNFNNKNKALNSFYERNVKVINNVEETLRSMDNNLNDFKELNKNNRFRTSENYQNVRFIEKLNKD